MKSYFTTDKGKTREVNQDYIFCSDEPVGLLPNLYIVADGMGGYNAGDFASRCSVDSFVTQVKKNDQPTVIGTMAEALKTANATVLQNARENEELNGMGTTFVAATVFQDKAYVMNVGDSRLYLLGNAMKQITVDHSFVEEMIRKGELQRKDARIHPKKNVITRAVGVEDTIEADYYEVETDNDSRFLLLCTDGLTNMVEDEEVFHIIMKYADTPQEAVQRLVKLANEHGGADNISIILVALKSE
ncbi:MAG: Stp1/IreP family PP2C-type Ser/Thr phosphatase [Lachnospiraceae bacterium]|nr:Stp1/IreP family PP2C-type Ser/Thr phosphatase [Lachnospiraceae bacterium]